MSAKIACLVHSEAGDGHINEDVALVRSHTAGKSLRAAASFPAAALFEASPWYAVTSAADEAG